MFSKIFLFSTCHLSQADIRPNSSAVTSHIHSLLGFITGLVCIFIKGRPSRRRGPSSFYWLACSAPATPAICRPPFAAAMALSSSRPLHLLRPLRRGFHASAQALARAEPHEFSKPSGHLGSWGPAGDPRQAWAQLDRLRKGYARDVRRLRQQYTYEVQLTEAERQRKAEARAEAARLANEERKAAKAAAARTRAAERRAFEEEFRQALAGFLSPSPYCPSLSSCPSPPRFAVATQDTTCVVNCSLECESLTLCKFAMLVRD
jgi:hypothetical protein